MLPLHGAAAAAGESDSHEHSHAEAAACEEPGCSDPSHDHSHAERAREGAAPCDSPGCTDPSHDHAHAHSHSHAESCEDPLCVDPSHGRAVVPNSAEALGFTSFVYRARRPFCQRRLVELVRRWPLPSKVLSLSGADDSMNMPEAEEGEEAGEDPTFAGVLRSKGATWLDAQHRIKASWSHAGRHFRLNPDGVWWATLPEPVMRSCLQYAGQSAYEAERAAFEGGDGDRRQEIVFIGTRLDEQAITAALDACLCTDDEMQQYRMVWSAEQDRIEQEHGPFRFEVGAEVECAMGVGEWKRGVVVAQYHREKQWPPERWTPYLVELEDGQVIWVPADLDACIRAPS